MRYLIPFCTVLLIGCSNSPTSPTPVNEAPPVTEAPPTTPTPPLNPNDLHWEATGAGCQATARPTPIPDTGDGTVVRQDDGSVRADWLPYKAADGREGLLTARFVPNDGQYVLCSWDISDL
ncbi:MAG: hypothetical protein R2712_19070 [Vicinamibacterales bacterium]